MVLFLNFLIEQKKCWFFGRNHDTIRIFQIQLIFIGMYDMYHVTFTKMIEKKYSDPFFAQTAIVNHIAVTSSFINSKGSRFHYPVYF